MLIRLTEKKEIFKQGLKKVIKLKIMYLFFIYNVLNKVNSNRVVEVKNF